MFLSYFNLKTQPFGVAPDPSMLWLGARQREVLAALYYAVAEDRGVALLLGEAGMGKTLLLRQLVPKLQAQGDVASLPGVFESGAELIGAVLGSLDILDPGGSYARMQALERALEGRRAEGIRTVLVLDRAEQMSLDALRALRLLGTLENEEARLLNILLAGQPSLARALRMPEFAAIADGIEVVTRLEPLEGGEVASYIYHRMDRAGGAGTVFAPEAIGMIANASGGVPRRINRLCHQGLLAAWSEGREEVDEEAMRGVLEDAPAAEVVREDVRLPARGA